MNEKSDATAASSVDEEFRSMAYTRLVETGERDRLVHHLRTQLSDCGWQKDLEKFCHKLVREKGVENITLEDLIQQVTPEAWKNVPAQLKSDSAVRIRQFLNRELAHPKQ